MDISLLYGIPNQSFFDSYWAAVHFVNGILVGLCIVSFFRYMKWQLPARLFGRIGSIALISWEYFEVVLRYLDAHDPHLREILDVILPHSFFDIESTGNILSDLILGGLGLYLAYRYWKSDDQK